MILIDSDDKYIKPKDENYVFAINENGYLGLAMWNGESWFDACKHNMRIKTKFKWIHEDATKACCPDSHIKEILWRE